MIKAPFSFYGGKSRLAHLYPPPKHDLIIEPFCGAASYSFAHAEREVWLNDLDYTTYMIWYFLTGGEVASNVVEGFVPSTVQAGQKVSDLIHPSCHPGLIALCRAEANQGTQGARGVHDQITTVGAKCWNARFKAKTLEVIKRVGHWKVTNQDYQTLTSPTPATWFVDPPYANAAGNRYRQPASAIDFTALGEWCKSRNGQVVVCENAGANWLPFTPLATRRGMRGRYQQSNAMEVYWVNEDE